MELLEEFYLLKSETSFADESFRPGDWFKPVILAQISTKDDLLWFLKLKRYSSSISSIPKYKREKSNNYNEIKAYEYYYAFSRFDSKKQREICQLLKNVIIIIEDPKYYFNKIGFTPVSRDHHRSAKTFLKNNDFEFILNFQGKSFFINMSNPVFYFFKQFLIGSIFDEIISSSPLHRIESDIKFLNDYCWTPFYAPQISNLVGQFYEENDDIFKKIEKTIPMLARFRSAFWDYPKVTNILNEKSANIFFPYDISYSYKLKLQNVIARQKIFDDGNSKSIDLMKKSFAEIDYSINRFDQTDWVPQIKEMQSFKTIEIQAADFASYFARIIYEEMGISKVRKYFKNVLFNGKSNFQF